MPRQRGSADGKNAAETGGTRATSVDIPGDDAKPSHPPGRSKRPAAPGLHVVATPIGNAEDITLRALAVLADVDLILCEDTRVTAKLLSRHHVATRTMAYHDHNAERVRPLVLDQLRQGKAIALVSDAGTPMISDPGFKLVRAAIAEGLPVTTLPGPSAPLAALVLSGLPSDRFLFAGFLPVKTTARRQAIAELAAVPATLIFFESAPRLAASLADMTEILGNRAAAVAREITKLYEEIRRGTLAELAAHFLEAGPPRGEVVVVIGPPAADAPAPTAESLDAKLVEALAAMSVKDASAAVAASTGLPRRQVYARALTIAGREK